MSRNVPWMAIVSSPGILGPFSAGLLALVVAACASPAPLRVPDFPEPRAERDRYPGGIRVGKVSLITQQPVQVDDAKRFRDALVRQIEGSYPRRDSKLPSIEADLLYRASLSSHRTYILDYFALATLGLWPFTPQWGYTQATAQLWLRTPPDLGAQPDSLGLILTTSQPYSTALYSWFRSGPAQRAFDRTHLDLSRYLNGRIDYWWSHRQEGQRWSLPPDLLRFHHLRPFGNEVCYDFDQQGELVGIRGHRGWRLITDEAVYDLPDEGQLGQEDQTGAAPRSWWRSYLRALSGLEVGYFGGTASVSSVAVDDLGERFTIASGNASSEGWKLTLFNPPTKSEVFIYPTLGFFSLDIDIADMEGDIPLGRVPNATDIPAVGSDPLTGAPIDLGAPNVYSLRLRSGYIGQRLGGTLVWGTKRTQLFLSGEGGLNLLEWRYTDVELGSYQESGHSARFFHSFAGRGLVGLVYRPWHVGARCEVNIELYREFSFPRAMPFEGRVQWDPSLQTYVRKEIKVDAAKVQTINGFCGLSLVY